MPIQRCGRARFCGHKDPDILDNMSIAAERGDGIEAIAHPGTQCGLFFDRGGLQFRSCGRTQRVLTIAERQKAHRSQEYDREDHENEG